MTRIQTFLSISSILTVCVISQCDDGWFYEINGTCKFNCDWEENYVAIDTLSFDTIKESCSDVKYANILDPSGCKSLNDLVWRNDSCTCPYCKCTKSGSSYYEEKEYSFDGPYKTCYGCECGEAPYYYDGLKGEMIYDCSQLTYANDPTEWEEYGTCPPNQCTYSEAYGGNKTVYSGTYEGYWWQDGGDSDDLCTEFCYCPPYGDTVCATGYAKIMANSDLKKAFMKDCGSQYYSGAVK